VLAFRQTSLGTGCFNCCVDHFRVTQSIHNFLGNQDFITDRAVLAFRQTSLGAGGGNCFINHFGMTQSVHNLLDNQNVSTDCAALTFCQTSLSTGSGLCGDNLLFMVNAKIFAANITNIVSILVLMAQGSHLLLSNQDFIANRAVLAFRQAGGGAGGGNRCIDHFSMAQGVNNSLGNQNLITDRAVLAFRQAGGGTGGSNRCIDHFRVTQSVHNFLSSQDFATDRAVLAFRQTSLGTGCFNCCVDHFGMAQSIHNFLGNQDFITDGTMLAFRQTGVDTVRFHCCIGYFGMAQGVHNFLGNQDFITDGTMLAFRQTGVDTVRFHCCINHFGMTQGIHNSLGNQDLAADRAVFAFRQTGFSAGGGNRCIGHFGMAQGFHNSLGNQDLAADRTVLAFRQTGFRTGSGNGSVDYFGVTQGIHNSLGNQDLAADRAVLAFRQTSLGAGCFNCCVNHFRVTQCVHNSLGNQDLAADRAVLAFRQTGVDAVSFHCFINHFGVTQSIHIGIYHGVAGVVFTGTGGIALLRTGGSGHHAIIPVVAQFVHIVCNIAVAAAAGIGRIALLGTGGGGHHCLIRMAQSIHIGVHHNVTGVIFTGMGGIALLRTGGSGHHRFIIVANGRTFLGKFFLTGLTDRSLHTGFLTGSRIADQLQLVVITAVHDPHTLSKSEGDCRILHIAGLHIGAVRVLQLGIGQRDLIICLCFLPQLISNGLGAGIQDCSTAAGGEDIGTAGCGVDIALGCVHGTVDLNAGIHQVRIGTGVGFARCVSYRDEGLVRGAAICTPLVRIVNIHIDACAYFAGGARIHDDLGTGQEGHILAQGNGAAFADPNRNIAVDAQIVVLGIDGTGTHLHTDGGQRQITVGLHHQSVLGTVIVLDHIAGGQVEHSTAGGNKANRGTKGRAGHIDSRIRILRSAGMEGQGDLNILDIVLRQGEHAVLHGRTLGAATEVGELEQFVHGSSAVGRNAAGAVNVTVDIQHTAAVDGNVAAALHLHKRNTAGGRAAIDSTAIGVLMLCRNAHGTVNGQACAIGQGQCPVSCGGSIGTRAAGCGSIKGIGIIEGDQQGNTGGDGMIARQGTAVHHHDSLAVGTLLGSRSSRIQIVIQMGTGYGIVSRRGT